VKPTKAPGYWPTRILLAATVVATAILVAFAVWSALWMPDTMGGGGTQSVFGLPSQIAVPLLAGGAALVALGLTIRIFRGPRDEPPPWRYRDR